MSPSRRRRGASPDPHSKRRRSRSRSPSSSRHRRRSPSRSPLTSHRRRRTTSRSPPSSSPHRKPVFASHHDHPDLPEKVRLLCEILSSPSSHSQPLLSLLDNSGIVVKQSDVEAVLRLSYSHPGPSLTFFRWAGERHLNHMHSCYSWNLVVDLLGKNLHFDAMWDTVRSMRDINYLSISTFASIFESLASDGRAGEALAAFRTLRMYGIQRDTLALNLLLAALCRAGLVVDGRAMLREAVLVGVAPDVDSFAILLEGCENEKDAKCAQKVFDEMIAAVG